MGAGNIEEIRYKNKIIAIILSNKFEKEGIEFITPLDFSQQLAYIKYPKGKKIQEHTHNLILRKIYYTQETLFIKRGKLRVDFYSNDKKYIDSRILKTGDVILLCAGGHGFECLEETEMVEVKQGPYSGGGDKVRFRGKKT